MVVQGVLIVTLGGASGACSDSSTTGLSTSDRSPTAPADPFGPGAPIIGDWVVPDDSRLLGIAFPERDVPGDDGERFSWVAHFAITADPRDFLDDIAAQYSAQSSGGSWLGCTKRDSAHECQMSAGSYFDTETPNAIGVSGFASVMDLRVGYMCDDCESPPRSTAMVSIFDSSFDLLEASSFPVVRDPPSVQPESFWPMPRSEVVPGLFRVSGGLNVPNGVRPLGPAFSGHGNTGDFHAVFAVEGEADLVWRDVERSLDATFADPLHRDDQVEVSSTVRVWRASSGEAGGYSVEAIMVYDTGTGAGYLLMRGTND